MYIANRVFINLLCTDFTLEENVVFFQTVNTTTTAITKCIALNINDDVILEYDEHFVLSLDSQFNSVIIPSPTTMVIILNNDRKCSRLSLSLCSI